MAVQTFRDLWSIVALHAPLAPVTLVQHWCQEAYDDLLGKRHWSFLRTDGFLRTLASRSLEVGVTELSTAVTSAALFVSTDAGRQFRINPNTPIYTIDTVTDASNLVLTQPYQGTTNAAATASIQDIYLTMPANFRSFNNVTDSSIQRPIAWWISKDRLDLFDPGRIAGDTRFRVLCAASLSDATATYGQIRYEAWPWPSGAGVYSMQYFRRTDTLTDDDRFTGPLATWTNALSSMALASAARWPGTVTQKNPYFSIALATKHDEDAQHQLKQLDIADDDIYLMDLQQVNLSKFGLAALSADTTLMRASDATLADYY